MLKNFAIVLLAAAFWSSVAADNPRVWLDTNHGPIILELDEVNAPITTDNFLAYVNEGFYDGIVFHRVVDEFVIQAGGFNQGFEFREPLFSTIQSETDNGLGNLPGTIAMALAGGDINSARSQFYINTVENDFLNEDFTVFGEVVAGMNNVTSIEKLRTGTLNVSNGTFEDAPVSPPVIHRAVQVDGFPIMPLHTASWFDPANSGVGFNIEVTNDASVEEGPLMVVYWYDFSEGNQVWMTGATAFEFGASEVTVDLVIWQGEDEAVDFLSPPDEFQSWGSLTISFSDCATGHFQYDSSIHGQGEVTATRLTIPDRTSCEGL